MKYAIKHRYTNAVLYETDIPDDTPRGLQCRAALEKATQARANLDGAYLAGANLDGANLAGAYLAGKKLIGKRPVLMIGPIGSRSDYLAAYLTDAGVVIKAGCFTGSVAEFEKKLTDTHGDNEHAQEYKAALVMVAAHASIWTPKEDVCATK